MKKGTPIFRILTLAILAIACLGAIVARLWWVQIARGDFYKEKVLGGSRVSVRLPAVRGEIMDRNGVPLVENRKSFEIDFYLPDIVRAYRQAHDGQAPVHPDKLRLTVRGMAEERDQIDIAQIVNETIIPRLKELNVEQNYNAERMQVHYRNDTLIPFNYAQDLDFDSMAKLMESNLGLPGLKADVKPVRFYPYKSLAAHILGYVGAEREVDQEEAAKFNFYQPDVEGKAQIEKAMDRYLKGTAGSRILQKDVKGQILEDSEELVEPIQGDNVYLTIDARLQYIVEDTLRAAGRAAAVVVNPNNGDILAMASVPSFDPNNFIPSIAPKDWAELINDETSPLMNRAINSYAPGSIYKVLTALAMLRAGDGDRRFNCSGGVSYGNTYMRCWISGKGTHGTLDLEGAIKQSCNAYFYLGGNVSGIDEIVAVGNMLGLGQKSGLPLSGENAGILPGKEWLAQTHPRDTWRPGYTANASIGQGFVLASPLQMAMVTAALANGGTVYFPRIVDKVVAQDGKVVSQEPAQVRADLLTEGGLTPEDIEHVRRGMWEVVNESGGTARRARLERAEVAGKTGTAQNLRRTKTDTVVKDNHTWFIAFAPYDAPKYAVCVLVQGAKSGGGVAGPVAARILDEALALDAGELEVKVEPMEPAVGNFVQIDAIDFGRDIPAATTAVVEEVPTGDGPSQVSESPSRAAEPSIRAEPDDQGRVTERSNESRGLLDAFFNSGDGNESSSGGDASRRAPRNPFRR
jgi:penicillin-binding protein 2